MDTNRRELTLSQLQAEVGNAIRMNRATQNVWVKAEFSDLRVVGGHCYMELLEKDEAGSTRAKLRAMIWSSHLGKLRRRFFEATGRDLGSGMKVLVYGSVTHHNLYGLSFTISDIDPSYTLGDMERLRREILEKLHREGILNSNKNLQMPEAPQRIAVISAPGAAGYGDFMNQIESNPDGFAIYTKLFSAVMQGERTAPSVMAALEKVEMTLDIWDCVVIIRGGGATTDLNGFDNYELARRVATFPLPVVVGIGHERDRTVLDDIACVRCKTPTAVAGYIIDALRVSYTGVRELVRRIAKYGSDAMRGEHLRLSHLAQSIPAIAENRLLTARNRLTRTVSALESATHRRFTKEEGNLQRSALRIESAIARAKSREELRLKRLQDLIRVLSPDNTLKRGFSITRINGHAISSAEDVKKGEIIETTFYNGKILSRVEK